MLYSSISFIANGTLSSSASTSSSRNNSPRPLTEAKLRPGVTNRNLSHLQQRNSVNYTGSTLQEDLMKLINPDYNMSNDDNFNNGGLAKPQKNALNSHSLGNIAALAGGLKTIANIATTDDIFLMRKKSRSREGINLGSHGVPISGDIKFKANGTLETKMNKTPLNGSTESDVIFTTARPATVISSSSSSSSNTMSKTTGDEHNGGAEHVLNHILHIEENASSKNSTPRKSYASNGKPMSNGGSPMKRTKAGELILPPHTLPLLPDTKEVDWTSLVDSAITQINEGLKKHYYDGGSSAHPTPSSTLVNGKSRQQQHLQDHNQNQNDCVSQEISSISPSSSSSSGVSTSGQQNSSQNSLPELQNQVTQLEDRITKETRRRKSLEQAVRRLTEENRRLQDESQAAVQQLRRFSEWFFQTVDRET